jgi:SAM-dependent methyltransferase
VTRTPFSPAADRNKDAILPVLQDLLDARAQVLEIGSGSGQHALHFCAAMPGLSWQPTELEYSIEPLQSGIARAIGNIRPAITLDVCDPDWQAGIFDVIFTANTLHIMSWQAVCACYSGAGRYLRPGGLVLIYGPFQYHGQHTTDSNRAFDLELRRTAPQMGIRDVAELSVLARNAGLLQVADIEMPVNNRVLVYKKAETKDD